MSNVSDVLPRRTSLPSLSGKRQLLPIDLYGLKQTIANLSPAVAGLLLSVPKFALLTVPKASHLGMEPFALSRSQRVCSALQSAIGTYFLRWKGEGQKHPPPPPIYRVRCADAWILVTLLYLQ